MKNSLAEWILNYFQMYGRYKEDLGQFAKSQAQRISPARSVKSTVTVVTDEDDEEGGDYGDRRGSSVPKFGQSTWLFITHWTDYVAVIWNMTFARIGEDWIFLAMLGIIMALLSYIMDRVIYYCTKTRLFLFESSGDHLAMQYFAWTTTSISLILFATGFVHLVAPQAIGSGIPEIKTILRGVVLKEYVLRTNLFHSFLFLLRLLFFSFIPSCSEILCFLSLFENPVFHSILLEDF